MSLTALIGRFKTGTYTRTRTAAGSYDTHGVYTAGSAATSSVDASIQPSHGRDLQVLPEGRRGDEIRTVYCMTELRTTSPAGAADKLTVDGETWEVIHVFPWASLRPALTYYRALIARTTPSGGP